VILITYGEATVDAEKLLKHLRNDAVCKLHFFVILTIGRNFKIFRVHLVHLE